MIDFIRRLQESKAVKMDYPNIFDESNVISLFGIMDPSSKGHISYEKYLKGSTFFQSFNCFEYIFRVNLFCNSLSCVFDLSYHFSSCTCSFLHCVLVDVRNIPELENFG